MIPEHLPIKRMMKMTEKNLIKQKLSEYVGASKIPPLDPKDPEFKEKRKINYNSWIPNFNELKQRAEAAGLSILEYFAKERPDLPKEVKKIEKDFVPPDPVVEQIPELSPKIFGVEEAGKAIGIEDWNNMNKPLERESDEQIEARFAKDKDYEKDIPLEEEEFPCPHCNKIYNTQPSLKRHITMKHPEVAK